ncbi:MAG: hypothetical protein ABI091_18175 [Ferruginibacter sp.]
MKDIVSKERHIPKSAILINASHTHFPPSAQNYPTWVPFLQHPDTLYLNILNKGLVKAIGNALDNMSPANLYFGRGETNIGLNRDYLPEYIQFINIGSWKLVGLSREAVNEYGPAIRKIWPDKNVSVAGYCNDLSSYLPKEWHINNQTYEGYDSFFWYGQPGLPPVNIFDIVIDGIKSFK